MSIVGDIDILLFKRLLFRLLAVCSFNDYLLNEQ